MREGDCVNIYWLSNQNPDDGITVALNCDNKNPDDGASGMSLPWIPQLPNCKDKNSASCRMLIRGQRGRTLTNKVNTADNN